MRSRNFQGLMTRLALAAVLLLVLAPTLSRLLDSPSSRAGGLWESMCTAHGLQLVRLPIGSLDSPQLPDQGEQRGDCDYCPLLNALTALAVCAILLLPPVIARFAASPRRSPPQTRVFFGNLGARGPPLMA